MFTIYYVNSNASKNFNKNSSNYSLSMRYQLYENFRILRVNVFLTLINPFLVDQFYYDFGQHSLLHCRLDDVYQDDHNYANNHKYSRVVLSDLHDGVS